MSYILDALKRAERERKLGQAPLPLDEIAVPPPPAGKSSRHPLLIGAALAIALILTVAVFLLLRGPKSPPAAEAEATVAVESTAPSAVTATKDAADDDAADDAADARIEDGGQIASLDDLTENADAATSTVADSPPASVPNSAAAEQASAKPAANEETSLLPGPDEQSSDDETTAVSTSQTLQLDPPPAVVTAEQPVVSPPPAFAAAAPPASNPDAPALRRLKDMPSSYRADFPALTVDVHVYNADPQRRFVLINGRRYREADVLAEGPRIVQITQDGIVVDWRGETVLFSLNR